MDLNDILVESHKRSKAAGWWHDPITGLSLIPDEALDSGEWTPVERVELIEAYFPYVIATKIALIHSEISEALEGYRSDKPDDKIPERPMIEVELADAIIRIGDLAECLKLDVVGAIAQKFEINAVRPDHKLEARRAKGGKKF